VIYNLVQRRAQEYGFKEAFAVVYVGEKEYWLVTEMGFLSGKFWGRLYNDVDQYMGGCLFWSAHPTFIQFVHEWPEIKYVQGHTQHHGSNQPKINSGEFCL
jgi:hypothetical protein